jgi:poly-gamma-glutamate capsule biosynthesis protein CapA/YwtB (metallophosphatase superfamily)
VFARAGIDVMNLANNHALDFGPSGQSQTTAALRRHRIAYTGRPGEVLVRRVGGTRIALVGFAPYPWAAPLLDPAAAMRLVRKARRRADVVVVLMHAGAEGSSQTHTPRSTEFAFGENRGRPRAFAHAVVRAGADIVLGSGPHVVRGIERYRRRLIAYSLGNFVGYRTLSTGGVLSLSGLLTVRLSPSGVPLGGRWWSVRLDPSGIPHLDRSGASARFVAGLSRQDFGPAAYPMRPHGGLGTGR